MLYTYNGIEVICLVQLSLTFMGRIGIAFRNGPIGILEAVVYALFYGLYDSGPTISVVELIFTSGCKPLTALLS